MEPLIPNTVYAFATYCSLEGQASINRRLWYVTGITGTSPTMQEAAVYYDNLLEAPFKAVLATPAQYDGTLMTRRTGLAPFPVDVTTAGNRGPGTAGATPLPKQTAGLIGLYTAFQGRRFRGRVYVPFPSGSDNTVASVPTAGYLARLATLGAFLVGAWTFTGVGGGVVTFQSCLYIVGPPARNPFINLAVERGHWATQRRRGDFGRLNAVPF